MLMQIAAADPAEISAIRKLLAESGLPADDLMEPLHTRFLAARTADGQLAASSALNHSAGTGCCVPWRCKQMPAGGGWART